MSVQATDIPPKETVTYTKQTQTASTGGGGERDGKCERVRVCVFSRSISMRIELHLGKS